MRSFTGRKLFAASTGGIGLILGTNQALTFNFIGTEGGGLWSLDKTPVPDPMRVETFYATLMRDLACYPTYGTQIMLGKLTGIQSGDAIEWVKIGLVGMGGDLWVRSNYPFTSEYGLCVYVAPALTSGDYSILAGGSHG